MDLKLQSPTLTATISTKGAELVSIKNKQGDEFMWQADPSVWPRHSPILFPIVGRLKDDKAQFNGKQIHLSQHGFARDKEFAVINSQLHSCTLLLKDDEQTRKNYPFSFELTITYHLEMNTIRVSFEVNNPSQEILPFSIGAHPGFNCMHSPGETLSNWTLEFEKDELKTSLLDNGLRGGAHGKLILEDNELPLHQSLFDNDALIFENNQVHRLTLASNLSGHSVTMVAEKNPYFGVWSKQGFDRFVCLEPWWGITDPASSTGDFNTKEGVMTLNPSENFQCHYSMTFH